MVMISFEFLLRSIPNDYAYKKKYLDSNSNNIEVLFLGSSHIYYGINPEYMSRKTFNGAHISQTLHFDLAILEKYSKRLSNLQFVIIPIDYFSLYSTLEGSIENWRIKNYRIYYGITTPVSLRNSFEVLNGKLPKNIARLKAYLYNHKKDITCNTMGFGTNYNAKNRKDLFESGKTAAKRHTKVIANCQEIYAKNIQTINSMITFCKNHHIKIVFMTCPTYSTYRENLNPIQLNNTINTIKQMCAGQSNVYYYNFLSDSAYQSDDFYDADHLNEFGAKKMTLQLDSILKRIDISAAQ
jgi:hypothetical protein